MRLSQYRLRTRIFVGFGFLIVLLLGVTAFGSYGLSAVGLQIGRMDSIAGNVRRVQEIVLRLEVIRRSLTRYRIDADAVSMREATEAAASASTLLSEAIRSALSEPRREVYNSIAEKLRGLTPKMERFTSQVGPGIAGRARLMELSAELDAAAGRLVQTKINDEAGTDQTYSIQARASFRSAIIASLRFMVTLDPALMSSFKKDVTDARDAMSGLSESASPAAKVSIPAARAALDEYTVAFEKVSVQLGDGDAIYTGQIRPDIRDMQMAAGKALDGATSAFEGTTRNAKSVAADTFYQQLGLSGAGALIGIIFALLIARSVIRPVTAMTSVMTRLAAGDTAADVPARDNTDEIGEMARAVEVFRQQAIENVRL